MDIEHENPVVRSISQCLIHVPDLVRFGSKPRREIINDPSLDERLSDSLRPFSAAVRYAANQTYIGNLTPTQLATVPRPWYQNQDPLPFDRPRGDRTKVGPFGEIVSQDLFFGILAHANVLQPPTIELTEECRQTLHGELKAHHVFSRFAELGAGSRSSIQSDIDDGSALPLYSTGSLRGCVRRDNRAEGREDINLDAYTLLEGLCAKASGAIALQWLLHREGVGPESIDYVISCGEEAAGDRYQRGGGGVAKAIAEMCGCINASGMDVKNFCAAPASALVTAGTMVKSGLYRHVAVVAGGSLAKLGMKFQSFLDSGMPILDDCLGATAFLVTTNDGVSPILHIEPGAIGAATVGASTSDQAVYRELIVKPLQALNLRLADIDKFAPELHNPEIMEYSGSGDVVHKNYRMIAAMAVMEGEIAKPEMAGFIDKVGMVGFAPTQGHIPSAIPYIGHAAEAMRRGELRHVMFLCKASLFLNRLTNLYDGVSFILEANPGSTV
jgi:betaine reductase